MDILPWNNCYCERCGQPVVSSQPKGVTCADCQQILPVFFCARAPLRYAFPIDTALKALKFRRQLNYAPAFAELLLPTLTKTFTAVDALVPVPLHRLRHSLRGFNQAAEICTSLARQTKLSVNDQARRIRSTQTQSGLSARQRRKNIRDAFSIQGALTARYPLIVDDVITTGTTCEQLAAALLAAGAKRVGVLAVARASIKVLQ